jgi:FtsP/CotA-like multicopper oxidase with cupredoxin domain
VTQGEAVQVTVTNALDEPHAWAVPALEFTTGPIAPGQTVTVEFTASNSGTFLYYDNLNEPVNRVMGLHGALVVMPAQPAAGHKFTPYDNPTPKVQRLFDDLGSAAWWPGLAWEDGDPATATPPFRQYIWLLHQASPNLFAEVGDFPAGQDFPADQFVERFLHDPFSATRNNAIPQYFTISGQAGHFSHNTPYINPNRRVGEPVLIRLLNAGLWTHSMHLHANHFFVLNVADAADSVINPPLGGGPGAPGAGGGGGGGGGCFISTLGGNPDVLDPFATPSLDTLLWLDVFTVGPMDLVDWLVPYMRPPDVPNVRGIGRADAGLATVAGTTWPPNEEIATILPDILAGLDQAGGAISLAVQLSPLCYPMHDHSEPTQTSQGGNYNLGMIAGMNFIGDRTATGGVINFPNQPIVQPPGPRGIFTPAVNPPWFQRE